MRERDGPKTVQGHPNIISDDCRTGGHKGKKLLLRIALFFFAVVLSAPIPILTRSAEEKPDTQLTTEQALQGAGLTVKLMAALGAGSCGPARSRAATRARRR